MLERESRAQEKIEELTRQLSTERQLREEQVAETAALRSKLLVAEAQLAEHVQSEGQLRCVRWQLHLTTEFAEVGELQLQHGETMRSTQCALVEAQSELQGLVQVAAAATPPPLPFAAR